MGQNQERRFTSHMISAFDYAARTEALRRLLEEEYGIPAPSEPSDPLEHLIRVILAQHASSPQKEQAFAALRARFPEWAMLADAPETEIVRAIWHAGLAHQKARRLQRLIAILLEEHGSLDLSHLRTMPLEEARAWLARLPGVGPLTASLVLLFALQRPALPINTAIHRVAQRVGILPPGVNAARAHDILQAFIPAETDTVRAFHINMLRLARDYCRASRPQCSDCPARMLCVYAHGGAPQPLSENKSSK